MAALLFAAEASGQTKTNIPGPRGSGEFGAEIYALPSGNIVVTDPSYSIPNGAKNVGAVYLYNGATGELISKLTGSRENDRIGYPDLLSAFGGFTAGIFVLSNGNFLVRTPFWNNGRGAVTFVNGKTGLSGVVSASNSLVGAAPGAGGDGDHVGRGYTGVTELSNGNYVVTSVDWDDGAIKDVGAVTLCDGEKGTSGVVSKSNSLVGSAKEDRVGLGGITVLSNGNYVVKSYEWRNPGDSTNYDGRGAATFVNGVTGLTGAVSASNSLVGSVGGDSVGLFITALTNGNYVVGSYQWNNGGAADVGAATFGSGTSGVSGVISASNSLIGSNTGDYVGFGMTALTNGNYVVNGYQSSGGSATFGDGTKGITGKVSASNSLVGRGRGGSVTALPNGNYVVSSPEWNEARGAATFGNGTTGIKGAISASNSLVGSKPHDRVTGGSDTYGSVTALSNGNYVVASPEWSNGAVPLAGAVTWGNGTHGITGVVAPSNSLVGSKYEDNVGYVVTALPNGNYVVGSPNWDRGAVTDAGASTFGDGGSGVTGTISAANSLVGSTAGDAIGGTFAEISGGGAASLVTPLTNGNYVIATPSWDKGGIADVGAVTFVNGTKGITGEISSLNSLVGSRGKDQVGFDRTEGGHFVAPTLKALPNGDYAIGSPNYNNGAIVDAGAITYGNGTTGTVGSITADNSYLGTSADAKIGGHYVYDAVNGRFVISRVTENIVTLFRPAGGSLLNISTRLHVGTGENALIGGFIVSGNEPKKVIIRAIGPSLSQQGVAGALQNPTLDLVSGGKSIAFNDNWKQGGQEAAIRATGVAPKHDLESAIVRTLQPGTYTAIVRGADETSGVGLVEVYDLAHDARAKLANISSRGLVQTGENVLIGGFIIGGGGGGGPARVIVRAIGPSLAAEGVQGALQNPTLDLVNANGVIVRSNDNWKDSQRQAIEATGIKPSDDRESALIEILSAGTYTAIVRGSGNTTGVGLVEVYNVP